MKLSITEEGFSTKPTPKQFVTAKFKLNDVGLQEIVSYIKNGHILSANFTTDDTVFTQRQRTYNNFLSTSFVFFDLDDDVPVTLEQLVDEIEFKPSIAYQTYSHQNEGKGNRYRLLYFFAELITDTQQYKRIYDCLSKQFNFKIKDSCGHNPTQLVFGTRIENLVLNFNLIYSINNFDKFESGHLNSIKEEEENIITLQSLFQDKEYINDYFSLPYSELLEKYRDKYFFFEHTPLPTVDNDTPYILLPQDYIEIKRYWLLDKFTDEHGNEHQESRVRRIKDGKGRRKKLFLNGILRRKMISTITFEHLLHCLAYELYHYIDNRKDIISKKELFKIARNVFDSNINNFDNYGKSEHPKFIVNPEYCIKYNLSKRHVRNLSRKVITYNMIGELYDYQLTDKQNIDEFKKYGLSICTKTLQRFREEYGITKYKRNGHSKSIKEEEENIIQLQCPIDNKIKIDDSKKYNYQCQLILDELEEFLNDGFYDIHSKASIQEMGRYFIRRAKKDVNPNYSNDELISMLKDRFLPILSA